MELHERHLTTREIELLYRCVRAMQTMCEALDRSDDELMELYFLGGAVKGRLEIAA